MDIGALVSQIRSIDGTLKSEANKAVNTLLTVRNWLIGYYLVVYEQNGADRATYGDRVLEKVAEDLGQEGMSYRNLRLFRQFFVLYPFAVKEVLQSISNRNIGIWQTLSAKFKEVDISGTLVENNLEASTKDIGKIDIQIRQTLSAEFSVNVFNKLSFSHISLLLPIDDATKRDFYAVEAIKGIWSVRELKRQINTLLYERSGISAKPELLITKLDKEAGTPSLTTFIKDLYTFEFLGLPIKDAVEEDDLETALLDHLQELFIEMGHGFCLEARQKRILIGDEYFFIDLVFYHRILKCHVLIELKVDEFKHSNAGQLNAYLNYYKKEVKQPDDNDPVGILLVTNKNTAMVEYAMAGMDEKLFVRKYMLQLPDKEQLQILIEKELRKL